MERHNYIDATVWINDPATEVHTSQFYSGGTHFYRIGLGYPCSGGFITPSLSVLEKIRAAADEMIAAYKKHEQDATLYGLGPSPCLEPLSQTEVQQ